MLNVKSWLEYKSNQFCNKCFDERVASLKIDGLGDNGDWKAYKIDTDGMNEVDIAKIMRDLFNIETEEDDDNSDS